MNTQLRADFRRFLECGAYCTPPGRAACAKQGAETLAKWREAEGEGLVRITAKPEHENYFDVYGEPDAYVGAHGRRVSAEDAKKEIIAMIERDGCWWVVSEYFDGNAWNHADSVGMCIYDDPIDPFENCYVVDLMRAALDSAMTKAEAECWP